jgi:hypothetical protein
MFKHEHPFHVEHGGPFFVHVDQFHPDRQLSAAFRHRELHRQVRDQRKVGTADRGERFQEMVLPAARVAPDVIADQKCQWNWGPHPMLSQSDDGPPRHCQNHSDSGYQAANKLASVRRYGPTIL